MSRHYYYNMKWLRLADCILLVFDANIKDEKIIVEFFEEVLEQRKNAELIFVANKIKQRVDYHDSDFWRKEERMNFINNLLKNGEDYIEIDCKEGYNIDELKQKL